MPVNYFVYFGSLLQIEYSKTENCARCARVQGCKMQLFKSFVIN